MEEEWDEISWDEIVVGDTIKLHYTDRINDLKTISIVMGPGRVTSITPSGYTVSFERHTHATRGTTLTKVERLHERKLPTKVGTIIRVTEQQYGPSKRYKVPHPFLMLLREDGWYVLGRNEIVPVTTFDPIPEVTGWEVL